MKSAYLPLQADAIVEVRDPRDRKNAPFAFRKVVQPGPSIIVMVSGKAVEA